MKPLAWILCLFGASALRAETIYGIPVAQGSQYSLRLSTPLQTTPAAGFFPVHIAIQNNSASEGSWRFEFTSGQGFLFPGEFSTGLTVTVPASQNRDLWYYIPVASPGVVLTSPNAPSGPRGGGRAGATISLPASTGMTTSTAIVELARRRLGSAGLSGPPFVVSSSVGPSVESGFDDLTVTFRQTSQFDLPVLPADRIPAGFDVADSVSGNGSRMRTFVYRELVPRIATAIRGGGTSALSGAIASALFRAMGQMPPPEAISQQTTSFPVLGSRILILLTQRGKESDLPPLPAVLPSGVLVTTRPAEAAGQVVRVISYTDPVNLLTLDTSTTASALEVARFELMRRGYLEPGVETFGTAQGPTAGARFTVNTQTGLVTRTTLPGAPQGAGTTATIVESGPTSRLPQPPATSLPPNATVTLAPGLQAGEVTRAFNLYYPPGVSAVSSRGIQAESAATIRFTTAFSATVSGPGIGGDYRIALGGPVPGSAVGTLPLAVSGPLEAPLRARLATARIPGNPNLTPVDPGALPADWRVWSSFHGLILSTAEYELLDPARRTALRQWMTLGGRVYLSRANFAEPQVDHIGLGELRILPSGIEDLDPSSIVEQLDLTAPGLGQPTASFLRSVHQDSALARYRVDPRSGYLLIAGFVVCFTIAVVPFNLLWLAPAGRRHRVFITTPLIALGGSALLALIILLREGIGGDGARDAVVAIMPGDNAAAVFQVQASRTGLIPSGRFPLRDDVLVMAIGTADNQAVSGNFLERQADVARGDWFRSRSMQAYHLRELVPTRGRVERAGTAPGGAPIVISTLATTLRDFVLVDADGRHWEIAELRPGERTSLLSAPASFSVAAWAREHLAGSEYLEKLLTAVAFAEPARWIAIGGKSEVAPIETLSSVDWAESRLAYTGLAEPPSPR